MNEIENVRLQLKKALGKRDLLIIQADRSIEELNKITNVMAERLREWYLVYFPEVIIKDNEKFVRFAAIFDRASADSSKLAEFFGEKRANELASLASRSIGSALNPGDEEALRSYAREIAALYKLRDTLSDYRDKAVLELAPNICCLVEPLLTAKLITLAGSMERLARAPASTVQTFGAEKALFKHLKKHSKPPKHGIIFLHPSIANSPRKIRGKIARALSTKISIAAKADFYTHRFIADKLKASFERRLKEIGKSR